MSYRVAIEKERINLAITEGTGNIRTFTGPKVSPNNFYRLVINKFAKLPGDSGPYGMTTQSESPTMPTGSITASADEDTRPGVKLKSAQGNDKGETTISNIDPTNLDKNIKALVDSARQSASATTSYCVTFALQTIRTDGGFNRATITGEDGTLISRDANEGAPNNVPPNSAIKSTDSAHLLIGTAYDDNGIARPLKAESEKNPGIIQNVYLFKHAITQDGIATNAGTVDFTDASETDLVNAGLIGLWKAAFDINGVVTNLADKSTVATSLSAALAKLEPLKGYETEGIKLYLNGYPMPLTFKTQDKPPERGVGPLLEFNAGFYKLSEISMWSTARQQFQILNDMFGRLIRDKEPSLAVYLPGTFDAPGQAQPMSQIVDNVPIKNLGRNDVNHIIAFQPASLSLLGSPVLASCGPLVTPNLYNPPGVALTVCDTLPVMTIYSVNRNDITNTLAGEINEVYAYIADNVLTLYAGKKVGDLVLTWVSQEQGDVQVIGYVEG